MSSHQNKPPPRQGLCCPENQRNAPNPFAPPPHLQSHPKKLNRPGSTLQTLQQVHSSSGYHKDPRCHAPPPQIHVPKHTDGHATSPGEEMGGAHPSPTDAHAGGVEPPPHPSVGPWATCVSPTCVAQPEGTSGDPVMAAERGGGTAACTQIWSCRGEPGEREGKWGGRGRGGGGGREINKERGKKKGNVPPPRSASPPPHPSQPRGGSPRCLWGGWGGWSGGGGGIKGWRGGLGSQRCLPQQRARHNKSSIWPEPRGAVN